MSTNSNSDKLHESDGSENNDRNWFEMAERATQCPGIALLDEWMDHSLEELESKFASFATQKSMRRNFGR
jgi:hypothetical protein